MPDGPQPEYEVKTAGWVSGCVLIGGLLATGLGFWWAWNEALEHDAKRFLAAVEQYRQEFETRAEKYEQGLENIADWISLRQTPTQAEWDNRMERMNLRNHYPGLAELAFAPGFHPEGRNRELWEEGHPDHWPPPKTWESGKFNVWYQTCQGPAAKPEWGRDLSGMFEFFGGIRHFFYSKGVRSTRRSMLPAEGGGPKLPAFTFLIASFRTDMPRPVKPGETYAEGEDLGGYTTERGAQRQMATIGLVAATICMEPFLESIFGSRGLEVDVDIYAGEVAETNRMTRLDRAPLTPAGSRLHADLELPWYVDRWHIVAVPNALFLNNSHSFRAWVVGAGGLALTLALFGVTRAQERGRAAAEAWARSLEAARQELRDAHNSRVSLERDLHDGILQSIYASAIGLRRAARWMLAEPAKALPVVTEVGGELEAAMDDIRRHLSRRPPEGVPPALLPETLAGLANAYNRTGQSKVELDLDGGAVAALTHEQSEQVFQCVREAVANAHRHGGAGRIVIRASLSPAGVEVLVGDDGRGFDPNAHPGAGRGLAHMRQRAELCGGRLELATRPGGPTAIRIHLPQAIDGPR